MDISIITVTWNSEEIIAEQIRSVILGCKQVSFEQFVVDNNSGDRTVEAVRQFPEVKLIKKDFNAGFGAANNEAAALSQGEFLLFLNPDMRVAPGSLDIMVSWMRSHPDVGVASCKLVDEDGRPNANARPRRFPRLADQLAVLLKLPHLFPGILKHYLLADFDPDREQEVDSVRGSFFLMRRSMYAQLGFAFDPRYFIWLEEVDACREAKRLGFKVMYTPIVACVDYIGQSFKQRATFWKQQQFTKSLLIYFKKWEPWYVWIWIAIFRPVGLALAWCADIMRKI